MVGEGMEKFLMWGFYFFTFYAFLPAFFSRMFGFRVFRGGRTEREIALTFDDGPDPVYTPQLLDLLKRHGARATFFVVGQHAEQHPELVRRMYEDGHDIGIHNYVHYPNWLMRPRAVKRQVQRTSDIIRSITGERPLYYRPPWGIVNVFDYANLGHFQIVLWTSMFGDWRRKVGTERLYRRMRKKLRPGEVFLLHDRGDTFGADPEAPAHMLAALERILEDGARLGYRFVNMKEMIALTEARKHVRRGGQEAADAAAGTGGNGTAPRRAVIGFGKRLLVAVWMLWERLFHRLFRLRPIGDGTFFHYRITRYSGKELPLGNGDALKPGDRVMELHFDNRMLYRIGLTSKSGIHTALRMIRKMEEWLPEVAEHVERLPDRETIRGIYGITLINRGAEPFGFRLFDLPDGWFRRLTNLYLHLLIAIIRPSGAKREDRFPLSPKIVFMPREELAKWKGRASGRDRVRQRCVQPAEPEVSGASGVSAAPGMPGVSGSSGASGRSVVSGADAASRPPGQTGASGVPPGVTGSSGAAEA